MEMSKYRKEIEKTINAILIYKQATFSDKVASITDYVIQLLESSKNGNIKLHTTINPLSNKDIESITKHIISYKLGIEVDAIKNEDNIYDLGADSLDFIELIIKLENKFKINLEGSYLVTNNLYPVRVQEIINEVIKAKQNV